MICKIGLIAISKQKNDVIYLNLGEVYDKNIKNNINMLYEIHKKCNYLTQFRAKMQNQEIIFDNII